MPRLLHVTNGTSTTITMEAAGIPGLRSIWADPLHEGPVPAGLSDDDLLAVRARYLAGADNGESEIEPVNDLRNWRRIIEAHDAYDELVLWFEHDLFDQLNLIQILSWIRTPLPPTKPVSLICIGSFPGRAHFKGLGELSAGELASLVDTRRPVSEAEYALAARAWRAFREPTPEPIDELRRADTGALPYLGRALGRFLQEYPSTVDGLSRGERRLLRLAEHQPIRAAAAFPRMHEDEDAYYISDLSFADLIETLSRTTPALLTVSRADTQEGHIWARTVSVTDAGREVLAARRDRVTCGIDRWLGGVHLQNGSAIWRWDDGRQRIARMT
jgi:hypothetical protein